MPITIKQINVKNLGPISEGIKWEMGKLNLIYGKNETGKTYMVEFLIHSLFKTKEWKLRPLTGRGKIIVEGLNGDVTSFSPSSSKKLEDFFSRSKSGLPADLSKLLVVKGAEVELGNEKADKIILKRYLSSREILDSIIERIPKTIQGSLVQNNEIIGPSRGDIKRRNELMQELKNINNLFTRINSEYLGGDKKILQDKIKELQGKLEEMEKARRHYAYTLSKKLENLKENREELNDEEIDELSTRINIYQTQKSKYQEKQKNHEELSENSKHYTWVKEADKIYSEFIKQSSPYVGGNLLLFLTIILMASAGIFSMLNYLLLGIGSLILGILFVLVYVKKVRKITEGYGKNIELEKIGQEYQRRFDEPLTNLAKLREKIEDMQDAHNQCSVLEGQLAKEKIELEVEKKQISEKVNNLAQKNVKPREWKEFIDKIKRERRELDTKIEQEKERLIKLNVEEEEYLEEEVSLDFNQLQYNRLIDEIYEIKEKLGKKDEELSTLKQLICQTTGDEINISWAELITNLRERYEEVLDELKELTARIIAQITVTSVIKEFSELEDESIMKALKSDVITKPLYEVTARYSDLRLDGENLYVSDGYDEFALNMLSTGAKEQVFLALRMGFCAKLLKQDSLFLVLDDAFQYSDWDRRKLLVDKMVNLVDKGWQIIYFTMDDSIKKLFDKKGRSLGAYYKSFELKT